MKRFEIINGKCVIPEGIDYIEDYEFYCSDDLREIVFPESLSSIGARRSRVAGISERFTCRQAFWRLKRQLSADAAPWRSSR